MSQQNQNQNLPVVPQSGAAVKPFSIRQYVVACRHRNISENWPFEEKHLQLCLKNGIKLEELLPALEQGKKTSHDEPLNDCSKMHSPNDDNNCSKNSAPKAVKYKRRRRKGKCKKRSMVDILAVARHSTSEEIDDMNKFCDAETLIEDSCRKGGIEDHVM